MKITTSLLFVLFVGVITSHAQTFEWAKSIGGLDDDIGYCIAVDGAGNVFSTGRFRGTVDFDPGVGTYNLTSAGNDIFILKLDSAGNFIWAKGMDGSSGVYGTSIAVDNSGNVYTTGRFHGTNDFDPGLGTSNLTSAGSSDIFISKLDTAGNFLWAKRMGGTSDDLGNSIAVDGSGNVYTTGYFWGTADFDPGPLTYNLTSAGWGDIFISKLDSVGSFQWAKRIGGTLSDFGNSIAVDGLGNVYTTGHFRATIDFDPGAAVYNLSNAGLYDIFVLKLDANGDFLWAKSMGGGHDDYSYSIALDTANNVYTTGWFRSTADFDPGAGIFNITPVGGGGQDIFISKLDASGNFIWAKSMGGNNSEGGYSIAIDDFGNVYTTGIFGWIADFDPGAGIYNLTSAGWADIFISKLDAAGNFLWAKSMGGISDDYGNSLAIDGSGNVYTTGHFTGIVDFDPGPGTSYLSGAGGQDIFITKLDASGNLIWAKSMGGTGNETGLSIVVDSSGNVHTTGYFSGNADFDPGVGTSNLTSVGQYDIFISKLDASGNFLWANSMGGASDDYGRSIAVDGSGNVYATGSFEGTVDFDPGAGTSSLTSAGAWDIFILKYNPCSISDLTTSLSGETITANNTSATYQWLDCGNNYAAIAGETGQTFTATANGNYAVELTENGCVDTSACVAITTVGILENSFGNAPIIYPNPTSGELSIDLGASHDEVTVIIRNILGQEVLRKSFGGSSVLQLNIPGEPGMYLIEISSVDKIAVVKVAKE